MINRKGFTLVEVIVTAVIVGVLAAVAIPAYLSFTKNTRLESAGNLAQAAATAANSFYRKTGNDPALAQLNLYYDTASYTVAVAPPNVTVTNKQYPAATKTISYR